LAQPLELYAEVEGRLVELNIKNGDYVRKDAVLAKLSNPEKQKELIQRQSDQVLNFHKALWYGQSPELENRAQAKQHEEFAEQLEPILKNLSDQIGKLTLISDRDGQVVGSPHKETLGQWLKPGKPFCEVGDPHHLEAHLIIDQADIHLIAPRRRAWIKIDGKAEKTYRSRVSQISPRSREEVPTELSNMAGGDVASKPDPKTGTAKPLTAVYEVIIPLENADLSLEPGLRGFAKIDGGTYTLAWWLLRWWNKLFNFQL
jgi:putative peptide zinc metalloprotease protein